MPAPTSRATSALVLAGKREARDALAEAHGASHRALLEVGGVPMLLRVLRALRAVERIGTIHLSIDGPDRLSALPEIAALVRSGGLRLHESADSPSRSVLEVLSQDPDEPFLVTTADHALLTPEMLDFASDAIEASDADLLVAFVARTVVRSRYPESPRTYFRLRGEAWTGANLFAFRTAAARRAAEFWVRAERFRKQPWRLVTAIGPTLLGRYLLGRLDLDAALHHASSRIGARVEALPLPFPEAAIDVDREDDLRLAEQILAQREGTLSDGSPSPRKPPVAAS
jgi:GTP:adenosylcobinamide-phosphate guanylyltransferase